MQKLQDNPVVVDYDESVLSDPRDWVKLLAEIQAKGRTVYVVSERSILEKPEIETILDNNGLMVEEVCYVCKGGLPKLMLSKGIGSVNGISYKTPLYEKI